MNGDNTNDAPNQPVNLDNGDTPYAAIFATTTPPAATAAAAYNIAHYAHFLSFGLKLDTEVFSKGNIKNMYDKETFDTKPVPDVPDSDTPESAAQHAGSTDSNYPYSLRNCTPPPYPTNTTKNHKNKLKKIDDKVTIEPPPSPDAPDTNTINASAQDNGSTNSFLPYSSRNCKFTSYSTNTTKNQKKREMKIDDKVTINTNPAHYAPVADNPNASAQDAGFTDYNSPYSLRNCKSPPYSITMKNH